MSASLAALQERFLASVLDGAPLADRVEPEDAVDFYRASVAANLRAALAAAYPVVSRLVGDAFFAEAARAYAAYSPSRSGDLHGFGARFATFFERYGPAASLAYLPDVARLEWAIHECVHADDARAIDLAGLAAIPESEHARLRVSLAPAVRCIRSPYPVHAIWQANQPHRDGVPERTDGADCVLVRRAGVEAVVERLDSDACALLEAFASGRTLERAIDALGGAGERFPALLAGWCADGVIAGFQLDPTDA